MHSVSSAVSSAVSSETLKDPSPIWSEFEEKYPHLLQSPHMQVIFRDLALKSVKSYQILTELITHEKLITQLEAEEALLHLLAHLFPEKTSSKERRKRKALSVAISEAFYLELPQSVHRWSKGETRERWMNFTAATATMLLFALLSYDTFLHPLHWLHWVSLVLMPAEIAAAAALLEPLGKNKFFNPLPQKDKKILTFITVTSTLASLTGTLIDGLLDPSPWGCNLGLVSAGIFALVSVLRLGWLIKEWHETYQQRRVIQLHLTLFENAPRQDLPEVQAHYQALQKAKIVLDAKLKNQGIRVLATGLLTLAVFTGILLPHLLAATAVTLLLIKGAMILATTAASILSQNALQSARRRTDQRLREKLQERSHISTPLARSQTKQKTVSEAISEDRRAPDLAA